MKGDREDLERIPGGTLTPDTAGGSAAADEKPERKDGASKVSGDRGPGGALEDKGAHEKNAVVRELRNTEREVIAHEAAHQPAAAEAQQDIARNREEGGEGGVPKKASAQEREGPSRIGVASILAALRFQRIQEIPA